MLALMRNSAGFFYLHLVEQAIPVSVVTVPEAVAAGVPDGAAEAVDPSVVEVPLAEVHSVAEEPEEAGDESSINIRII